MAPTIVTRAGWGARAPRSTPSKTTWSRRIGVAIHHSAGSTGTTVRQIQDGDMDSDGFSDIGYNWLVTQDGRVWEGRSGGWLAIGAHAGGQNTGWIGVCWIGTSGNTAPTPAALVAIRWLVSEARRLKGGDLQVRGHGQVPGQATECPGSRLRAWIAEGLQTNEEDEMELPDTVTMTDRAGKRYSYGVSAAQDTTTVNGALGAARGAFYHLERRVVPGVARIEATLKAMAGTDVVTAVREEFDKLESTLLAGLRDSLGEVIREEITDASDEQIESVFRRVFGSLDDVTDTE